MTNYKQLNNLFLRQSYLDSWQEYQSWLEKGTAWDYIILTASNEAQAAGYRKEILSRVEEGYLPASCEYIVLPDPEGKRVGSGGATFNVLRHLALKYGDGTASIFRENRILVIHSGGDSKRIPQYSVCGKLFSPVPRQLPDGRPSTLFDEFMISMAAVAGRFEEGMLVLSGDVLLLFNPLQLDFQFKGAAAISIKTDVTIGKNHGVFLNNGHNYVGRFLHKQSEEQLRALGAVNENGKVDLDTGAVLLDAELLTALFSLISTEKQSSTSEVAENRMFDEQKFGCFVNDRSRISFYGDFLYPLATDSTLEDYYRQSPEGAMCEELLDCRREIWQALSSFSMKLICLSPAEFIHFGTTKELLKLVTQDISDYQFLDWNSIVNSNREESGNYAIYNSTIDQSASLEAGCYIENCFIRKNVEIGADTIVSGVTLENIRIPDHVVLHGLVLPEEKYIVRIYSVQDNPKDRLEKDAYWMGEKVRDVLSFYQIAPERIWGEEETYLWFANLYPVCDSMEAAVQGALRIYSIFKKEASKETVERWLASERFSLFSSFNEARAEDALRWCQKLTKMIAVEKFVDLLKGRSYYKNVLQIFAHKAMTEEQFLKILEIADTAEFGLKIRIYDALSRYLRENRRQLCQMTAKMLEEKCFATIQETICSATELKKGQPDVRQIKKDACDVALPVRVNWGGGWTDTPPYCNENGGIVLNAAIRLNGIDPVQVSIRRLDEYHIEFSSEDIGVSGRFEDVEDILDCRNPYDHFALHKAALIACGLVTAPQIQGGADGDSLAASSQSLSDILCRLGGGIYLSTKVVGIPKGSGLGTSSILAGACVKAIHEFLGETLSEKDLYDIVLRMEQIMSTGGGWQDQVGGLCPGIKLITSKPGIEQHLQVERLKLSEDCLKELKERFVIIYTGQRRLARNLLRDVVGNYICGRPESVKALEEMKRVTILMKYELENGNIDRFASLLDEHWKLSLQLDSGASNTCIDQIFLSCEDLIDARFIAGAGGGGFLQAILKKGVTAKQLNGRLYEVFQDSGVGVWECEFV